MLREPATPVDEDYELVDFRRENWKVKARCKEMLERARDGVSLLPDELTPRMMRAYQRAMAILRACKLIEYTVSGVKLTDAGRIYLNGQPHANWPPERVTVLRRLYRTLGPSVLAQRFGLSADTVFDKAKRLGLTRRTEQRPWSDADIAFLSRHYVALGVARTAKALQRPESAVVQKARRLGVHPRIERRAPPRLMWPQRGSVLEPQHREPAE